MTRIVAVPCMALLATAALAPLSGHAAEPVNDKNWVAVNIFDSIYPMTDEQSFPEVLSSIEIMNQLFSERSAVRDIERALKLKVSPIGDRSREGHFLIWIHLSDDFVAHHPEIDQLVDPKMYMYPNRKTDIFTAWGGSVNIAALLTQGMRGLAMPIVDEQGHKGGNFQSFKEITQLGDADYSAGWYMNDDQAAKILTSFNTFPGLTAGYSFMAFTKDRPNAPFEPIEARMDNGHNCGDFVMYALNTAGVVSKDEVESIKIHLWYPKQYFDHPLPLKGTGQAGYDWLIKHPTASVIPSNTMLTIGWKELLFSDTGLEFFNKKQIVDEVKEGKLQLEEVRIWDQAHAISWLKNRAEFRSKGIVTELLPAVEANVPITSPERTEPDTPENTYRLSDHYQELENRGYRMEHRKLKRASLSGKAWAAFRELYDSMKHW